MPRTKKESFVFTLITAWMMVYVMTLYNIVLAGTEFTNRTFIVALKEMWPEYVIIFLCAWFISSRVAKAFAFRVVQPGDRQIFIILAIQTFTVVSQVALASVLGTVKGYGWNTLFLPNYLMTYCKNFAMALPLQLILVGPAARLIFRTMFRRKELSSARA